MSWLWIILRVFRKASELFQEGSRGSPPTRHASRILGLPDLVGGTSRWQLTNAFHRYSSHYPCFTKPVFVTSGFEFLHFATLRVFAFTVKWGHNFCCHCCFKGVQIFWIILHLLEQVKKCDHQNYTPIFLRSLIWTPWICSLDQFDSLSR